MARKSSMWGSVKTGTAASPARSVRKTVSPLSARCRMYTCSGGVASVFSIVTTGPPPRPVTPSMRTVYSVSSHSGRAKRSPTLRPDVSTVKSAAGVTVTCDGSISSSD